MSVLAKTKIVLTLLVASAVLVAASKDCNAHDVSVFDVGTRITIWVHRDKISMGFLVRLKNLPAQEYRKNCDLNRDMQIDDSECKHYVNTCCRKFIDNLHLKVNGEEIPKPITKTDVCGMIGEVGRAPFLTYIQTDATLDKSLYRVKIEYTNDNFPNEEPQIINDVNLSITKELDNLDIHPIVPIVQYIDRELSGHLFMEMSPDRHFFIEFGCRDIPLVIAPVADNDIMLEKSSSEAAKSVSPEQGSSSPPFWRRFSDWIHNVVLNKVEYLLKENSLQAWSLFLLLAFLGGMLHVIGPGHGKGVIIAYVAGTDATARDAVLLALVIIVTHTAVTLAIVLAMTLLVATVLPTTVQNVSIIWLTIASGVLVTYVGWHMLSHAFGSCHTHGHTHEHNHKYSQEHGHNHTHHEHEYQHTHSGSALRRAAHFLFSHFLTRIFHTHHHDNDEKEERLLESVKCETSKRRQIIRLGMATGMVPCVTPMVAAALCIQPPYNEYLKGIIVVLVMGLGQAIFISGVGIGAAKGVGFLKSATEHAQSRLSRLLRWSVQRLQFISSMAIIILGAFIIYQGLSLLHLIKVANASPTAEQRIAEFQKTLSNNPQDFNAQFNLGLIYAVQGDLEKSSTSFRNASAVKPEDTDSLRFEGHALAKQEKYEEALKCYETALKLSPEDKNLLFNLAYVEEKMGRDDKAVEHYMQAAASGNYEADFNLGLIYEKQSRLDEAFKYYLAVLEERPDDESVHMAIANTHIKKKEYENAAGHLLKVREKNPLSRDVNLALANIYLRRLEQPETAKPFVEAYIEHGGREEIEATIEELKHQEITTPALREWDPPEAARKFERIGACAAPFLVELARKQTGEELKNTLAAIAATEAPQAIPGVLSVLNNADISAADNMYDYGPGLGTPPVLILAREAFLKCFRKSLIPTIVEELVKVDAERNNREIYIKYLYLEKCLEDPFDFMESVLAFAKDAEGNDLRGAVDIALCLKDEHIKIADSPEMLKSLLSRVTGWWQENKGAVVWDKSNSCFRKKDK